MSKVCDGLRGDALEVGFDYLREVIDGRPSGINTLISHIREQVFPLTEQGPKELFHRRTFVQTNVSRRRRCWTLLTQVDPLMHLSEGHRSDMLLDLSGLTREERVMVQASINNERDF